MKAKQRNSKRVQEQKRVRRVEFTTVILFVFLMIAIFGEFRMTMLLGDFFVLCFKYLFGTLRYPMYVIFVYTLYHLFYKTRFFDLDMKFWGGCIVLFAAMILLSIPSYAEMTSISEALEVFVGHLGMGQPNSFQDGGGFFGVVFFVWLKGLSGLIGAIILSTVSLFMGLAMFLGKTLYELVHPTMEVTKTGVTSLWESLQQHQKRKMFDAEEYEATAEIEALDELFPESDRHFTLVDDEPSVDYREKATYADIDSDAIDAAEAAMNGADEAVDFAKDWQLQHRTEEIPPLPSDEASQTDRGVVVPYKIPQLDLLKLPETGKKSPQGTDRTKQTRQLQETLHNFGIKATVSSVQVGPAITQYEVTLAPGVKVSRIVNLSADIALALAAKGVRIEAPIPGKSAVGIEVPNKTVRMVGLYEVLRKGYQDKRKKLLVGLGRTINGDEVQIEINQMPHLLIAGATGSGKSVCVNAIILSILLRATPEEVKFLMIDPKKVELNVYNDIPHLLAPVVTNPKKAAMALRNVVALMDERYEIFAEAFVRNMEGYNAYAREHHLAEMPYIVVIIDELSDLMIVASKEVEESIMRLAQMARAAGIHLIVATQRPSVDVITGVIKSNIPSRIAFAVSSQVDSRTILDMSGAEKLVGKGDMLYLSAEEHKPVRVQGAYVSEAEIENIVSFVKEQGETRYDTTLLAIATQPVDEMTQELFPENEAKQVDELFEEAVEFAISIQMVSASKIQRRFHIGFNRAARIVDMMVEQEILGAPEGNKGRPVLIKDLSEKRAATDEPQQKEA